MLDKGAKNKMNRYIFMTLSNKYEWELESIYSFNCNSYQPVLPV